MQEAYHMFSWTLRPREDHGTRCHDIIAEVLRTKRAGAAQLEHARKIVQATHMRTCLRETIRAGIDFVERNPTHSGGLSFFVELLAGVQYASDDATVGQLKNIREAFRCGGEGDYAIQFLKTFAEEALRSELYKHKQLWFQLRVRCMDAYVLSIVAREREHNIIYYAGMAHTRVAEDFLLQAGIAQPMQDDDPLMGRVRRAALEGNLAHISAVVMPSGRSLVFLGEDHTITRLSFARELVGVLQELCHSTASCPTLFLIEKHISNNRDKIQRELTCNQPHLAIHASRCHTFVETDHRQCTKLRVLAVDNRHTDLGFMRIEVFDIWDDPAFRKAATYFLKSALESLCNFCEALLQCRLPSEHTGEL